MKLKSLVYFLLLNILISAATTYIVLTLWERSHGLSGTEIRNPTPELMLPAETHQATSSEEPIQVQTYQVLEGETLAGIAQANGLTIEELLGVNLNQESGSISAGDIIYIPVESDPGADQGAEIVFPDGEGYPDEPTNNGKVEIASIIGAGDLGTERVYLRGLGEGTLSLTGWQLIDEDGNQYVFPQITLFSNGAVNVYTGSGVDTVIALYWNMGESVWRSGENVVLLDSIGKIQATNIVP